MHMQCPICKKEMKKGYIPARKSPVQWIPDDGEYPITIYSKSRDGILIADIHWFTSGDKAESFYCDSCRMVLTPIKD